jgi:hypothetical protein
MVVLIYIKMKVVMWTLELGLVDKFVEVAPGHLSVCGRKKIPKEVPLLLLFGTWSFSPKL